jgi:hypothetical protein
MSSAVAELTFRSAFSALFSTVAERQIADTLVAVIGKTLGLSTTVLKECAMYLLQQLSHLLALSLLALLPPKQLIRENRCQRL